MAAKTCIIDTKRLYARAPGETGFPGRRPFCPVCSRGCGETFGIKPTNSRRILGEGQSFMSVRKKGRRKIVCNGKLYSWYVALDEDSPYDVLNVVSDNKELIIACPLNTKTPYVISKGNTFQKRKTNGRWNRYLLPFHAPEVITPKFVSELIAWATDESAAIAIKWDGKEFMI